MYFVGQQNLVEIYFTDCVISNIKSIPFSSITISFLSIIHFENIILENVTDTIQPLLHFVFNYDTVTMKNITVNNLSGTSTGLSDIIVLSNFPQTVTVVEQLHIFNVTLDGKAIVSSITELNQIQIINCTFEAISISSSDYMINTGLVKSVIFNSTTISNIKTTDDINTNDAVLFVNTLDLNSELDTIIKDITIDDCETPFVVLSSVINQSPTDKTLSLSNINFVNTHFENDRTLFSTDNIQLDTSLQISMTNFIFSNISFSSSGTLIECKQLLPTKLTITGSSFTDLNAAILVIESSSTQNNNLATLVQINDTVFDNINDQFNSLIEVKEGGQLEINN